MVNTCCVKDCTHRSTTKDGTTFHQIPKIITTKGTKLRELSERRRLAWLQKINRKNINNDTVRSWTRVCSKHFISGKPAELFQDQSPDWSPSLRMGYSCKVGDEARFNRSKRRHQKKEQEVITELHVDMELDDPTSDHPEHDRGNEDMEDGKTSTGDDDDMPPVILIDNDCLWPTVDHIYCTPYLDKDRKKPLAVEAKSGGRSCYKKVLDCTTVEHEGRTEGRPEAAVLPEIKVEIDWAEDSIPHSSRQELSLSGTAEEHADAGRSSAGKVAQSPSVSRAVQMNTCLELAGEEGGTGHQVNPRTLHYLQSASSEGKEMSVPGVGHTEMGALSSSQAELVGHIKSEPVEEDGTGHQVNPRTLHYLQSASSEGKEMSVPGVAHTEMGTSSSSSQAEMVGHIKSEPVEEGEDERFLLGSGEPWMESAWYMRTVGYMESDSVHGDNKSLGCVRDERVPTCIKFEPDDYDITTSSWSANSDPVSKFEPVNSSERNYNSSSKHVNCDHVNSNHMICDGVKSEHMNCDHVNSEHMNCDHVKSEHMNCDHVNSEHMNCDHVNNEHMNCDRCNHEHINCDHVNSEHINCDHVNSEHRSSSDVVTSGEPVVSSEQLSGGDRQTSTADVIEEDDWDMLYTVVKAEPQSDSDTEDDRR